MNAHDYNITTRRVSVDGQMLFEARVREFPDVVEFAETQAEAYELAIDTIETLAEIFTERGKKLPEPREPVDEFSGRVTLRLPKDLHRALALEAERQDISLNQYLVSALGFHCGTSFGEEEPADTSRKTSRNDAPQTRPAPAL